MHRFLFLLSAAAFVAGCGSHDSTIPAAASPTTTSSTGTTTIPTPGTPRISITPNGMQPLELTIAVGQRALFVNNDVRPHDVVGGIDPAHPDCPEIVQAGFLSPGQSGETGIFTTAKTCEYHDHTQLGVPAFQGRIIIR